MARKKQDEKRERVPYTDNVWVMDNVPQSELFPVDKPPFKPDEMFAKMTELIEEGFKITTKWDDYSNAFLCTAICEWKGHTNSGLAVSGRSGDSAEDAIMLTFYKYYVIAKRDLRSFADKKPKGVRG